MANSGTKALKALFADVRLALLYEDGSEVLVKRSRLGWDYWRGRAKNQPMIFGPWREDATEPVVGWALIRDLDEVFDVGLLQEPRLPRQGDRIVFKRGSIKSAAVGDILGITCVFMPSGFAVAVVPPSIPGGGGGGYYMHPHQTVQHRPNFWLPKRRWRDMPLTVDYLGTPTMPDVGIREVVRQRQQELAILAAV